MSESSILCYEIKTTALTSSLHALILPYICKLYYGNKSCINALFYANYGIY